jgi:hypothetical protein
VRVVQLVGGSLAATPGATRLAVTMYPAIGLCALRTETW